MFVKIEKVVLFLKISVYLFQLTGMPVGTSTLTDLPTGRLPSFSGSDSSDKCEDQLHRVDASYISNMETKN